MNDTTRQKNLPVVPSFRLNRRALLQTLASGVGAAAVASSASAASGHVHHAAATVAKPAIPAPTNAAGSLLFLDQHAFDTLALLSEQIVPGSRAAQVPEFLDRLLAVESTETQKHAMQALGAFERVAREAHGKPWKSLTGAEASALLTKLSQLPSSDATRGAFDGVKGAVAETYYQTEIGMKELGFDGSIAFAPPAACA